MRKTGKPTIHVFKDEEQMFLSAAEAFLSLGTDAIEQRGRYVVALAGGGTPVGLYRALTVPENRDRIDWNRVEFFWGDERTVPPDHEDSNFRMARQGLLGPLQVASSRIHRIEDALEDAESSAADYEREIANCFGVKPGASPPRFDLVLLGMGKDGHTASLFPNTSALEVEDRWVVANEVPQLSTTRITMTFPLINRARHIMFLVTGRPKANALAHVIQGRYDPISYPAQGVRPDHNGLEWFVDREASAQLRTRSDD